MTLGLVFFAVINIGIFLGYFTIARFVVPSLNIRFKTTKWGGAAFFALCAATHVELAYHAVTETPIMIEDYTSWHMLAIHIPQFIAVWVFTYGLYREVGLANGFLRLNKTHRILKNTIADIEVLQESAVHRDIAILEEALQLIKQVQGRLKE